MRGLMRAPPATALALRHMHRRALLAVARRLLRDRIRKCMDQLPEVYREVVWLRYLNDMNMEETATGTYGSR